VRDVVATALPGRTGHRLLRPRGDCPPSGASCSPNASGPTMATERVDGALARSEKSLGRWPRCETGKQSLVSCGGPCSLFRSGSPAGPQGGWSKWHKYNHEGLGGAEGNRTPDLCSAIAALSHLSYGPEAGPFMLRAWGLSSKGAAPGRSATRRHRRAPLPSPKASCGRAGSGAATASGNLPPQRLNSQETS
jgi:hypothetical protein